MTHVGRFHALLSAGSTAVNCMDVQPLRNCNQQIPPMSPSFAAAGSDFRQSTAA